MCYREARMNVVLPADIARQLGLLKQGDSAMVEVTETRPDGTVAVMVESEDGMDDMREDVAETSKASPELLAALNGTKSSAMPYEA